MRRGRAARPKRCLQFRWTVVPEECRANWKPGEYHPPTLPGACARGAQMRLHDRTFEECPLRPLRSGRAVDEHGAALDPHAARAEAVALDRLGVQDGVFRNFDVAAEAGIEIQPGMAVLGRRSEISCQQLGIRRVLRVLDDFGDEIGAARRRFSFSHNDPLLQTGSPASARRGGCPMISVLNVRLAHHRVWTDHHHRRAVKLMRRARVKERRAWRLPRRTPNRHALRLTRRTWNENRHAVWLLGQAWASKGRRHDAAVRRQGRAGDRGRAYGACGSSGASYRGCGLESADLSSSGLTGCRLTGDRRTRTHRRTCARRREDRTLRRRGAMRGHAQQGRSGRANPTDARRMRCRRTVR
jgi:hypothetical protein